MVQLLGRLGFIIAVELNVDADLGLLVERRQRGKRGRLLALAAKDIQGARIEILNSSGMGQHGAHGIGKGDGLVLAIEKAAHAPHNRGSRLQGDLELGDNAERATCADKEIDCVYIVRNIIARSIFGLGHGVVRKIELKRTTFQRHK